MNVETLTLAAYCIAIILASLLGGWLPSLVRMTHTRTQLIMSCVAGLMLGVALLHLLPHGLVQLQHSSGVDGKAMDVLVWWALVGMVVMLLLLRLFHFHQHDFGDEGHDQQHQDHCDHHHHDTAAHPLSWVGIAFGLGLHTLIDGIALGASVHGGGDHGAGGNFSWIGLGVFLAILLHKPLDALSITSMMQAGGWGTRARGAANLAFATLCPLGALLFVWGVGLLDNQAYVVGCALAFSAGVFLCISLGDLLPEVHFHSHDRVKLTVSFLVGIGLAYALRFVEPGSTHSILAAAHP
ncbi:MAG: ZIP family metal transporter [Halieaceae bacterium]|jgi:zinc and cadmium transporter|nr:ZIP family metal transporter [Halieaceae bacterium]